MVDYLKVSNLLAEMDIRVAGSIIEDTNSPGLVFVHVAVSRNADNKQVPSNRKLMEARQALATEGITVEFLLADDRQHDIEAGLRATILHAFGNEIRNVFMSVDKNAAHVWLEPKRELSNVVEIVCKKATTYLSAFDIQLSSLDVTTGQNLPSNLACLRAVRHLSPVDAPCLMDELLERGLTVPSLDWLKRRLDTMRRKGQVVRLEGDRYALPLASLRALGTVKRGTSADITRLLALARRGM